MNKKYIIFSLILATTINSAERKIISPTSSSHRQTLNWLNCPQKKEFRDPKTGAMMWRCCCPGQRHMTHAKNVKFSGKLS